VGHDPDFVGAHVYGALGAAQAGGLGAGLGWRLLIQMAASAVAAGKNTTASSAARAAMVSAISRLPRSARRLRIATPADAWSSHHRRRRVQHGAAYDVDRRAPGIPYRRSFRTIAPITRRSCSSTHGEPAQPRSAARPYRTTIDNPNIDYAKIGKRTARSASADHAIPMICPSVPQRHCPFKAGQPALGRRRPCSRAKA